jgi:hypothetical protein
MEHGELGWQAVMSLFDEKSARIEFAGRDVRFFKAETDEQFGKIRDFRHRLYCERGDVVVDDDIELDERSYLFGIESAHGMVACFRALPLPDARAGYLQFGVASAADCEVGRVAVATDTTPRLVPLVIGLSTKWIAENTSHVTYVGYCAPRLMNLYRRAGAHQCGDTVYKPGSDVPYCLLEGRFDVTAKTCLLLASSRSRRLEKHDQPTNH